MSIPGKQIRGIRQSVRSGSVLGRKSAGTGAVEEITLGDLTNQIISTGGVVTTGAANPQQWTAGPVAAVSTGLTISASELIADWQIGTVVANLGTNISISSGTLEVAQEWNAGTVILVGTGLTLIAGGTLEVTGAVGEWTAGSVSAIDPSLTLSAGTLAVTNKNGMLPLVNGDLPGPSLMSDPYGQCIGVFL